MKKFASLTLAVLLACALDCPALAAGAGALYPAEIVESTEGGYSRLEKIYHLTAADDPADIPTADFEREGYQYTLLDLTRTDKAETDTKYYSETVTFDSSSKDMDTILPQLAATCEADTEDGYSGTLTLDTANIKVEASGYSSSSRTVSATRTYPNLSDADLSLVPKTTQESGRTLSLADVQWQEAGGYYRHRLLQVRHRLHGDGHLYRGGFQNHEQRGNLRRYVQRRSQWDPHPAERGRSGHRRKFRFPLGTADPRRRWRGWPCLRRKIPLWEI